MRKGSYKLVTFASTKKGREFSRLYGKRLKVLILSEIIFDTQGRRSITVEVIHSPTTTFRFLQGETLLLPLNQHIIWQNDDGSKAIFEDKERVIPVHYPQGEDYTFTL